MIMDGWKKALIEEYLSNQPASLLFSVGNFSLMVGNGLAANSEFFQKAEHINGVWSVCPGHNIYGSCIQKHDGTEAVIEARFDVNLVFRGVVGTQYFIKNFLAPIWYRMFNALFRSCHGAVDEVFSCLQELEQILLTDTHGNNKVLLVMMAILTGYYWRYDYTIGTFSNYIEQLRPIMQFFYIDYRDEDQGDGMVRRADGSQQSTRNGYLRAGMPA